MIFKDIDSKNKQIKILEDLFNRSSSEAQKKLIKSDLLKLKAGYEAEKENAYYLDFEFKDSKNIILLHDVRIEHNGRTAQLDHLLISRLGVELLETKSSKGSITINDDGSLVYQYGKNKKTYPNPLEQSKRHALVLKEFIEDNKLLSKRISLLGGIEVSSKILIHPKTNVTNKKLPEGFERADSFISLRKSEIDNTSFLKAFSMLSKVYDIDKAKEIAQLLVDSHNPVMFDYTKKFRIKRQEPKEETIVEPIHPNTNNSATICPQCNEGNIILKEVKSKKAKDKYKQDKFLGCDRFPKCRYTESIK